MIMIIMAFIFIKKKIMHFFLNTWIINLAINFEFLFLFLYILSIILKMDLALADEIGTPSDDPAELRRPLQPQVNEWVPPIPRETLPEIPVLEQPLINDTLRLSQLYNRLSPHFFGQEIRPQTLVDFVYRQAEVEKNIEAALVLDGIHPTHVLNELNNLRGVLFYPRGTPLTPATLARYIREIARRGTRQSIPYRRVYKAIRDHDVFIQLLFLLGRR